MVLLLYEFEQIGRFSNQHQCTFNIICVTETQSTDNDIKNNSNFHLLNFDFIHQERKTCKKWGGILIYVKNHTKFKIIKALSFSDGDSECITAEIENKNIKILIIILCYRLPSGAIKGLNSFLKRLTQKINFVLLLVISI